MNLTQNSGYREIVLGAQDLDDFTADESFLRVLGESDEALVINLRQFAVMHSGEVLSLARWLAEVSSFTEARIVLFAGHFPGIILQGIMGHLYSVFTVGEELVTAVRQEVAVSEKDMLWS